MISTLVTALLVAGCQKQAPPAVSPPAPKQKSSDVPTIPQTKETAVLIESSSEDRLPPPEVPAVEREGVRYSQVPDGRSVGAKQVGGILLATDIATGKQLWTLPVYGNPVDPKMEADAQWLFFASMKFEADGRLRIVNEANKAFLVDVKARSITSAD